MSLKLVRNIDNKKPSFILFVIDIKSFLDFTSNIIYKISKCSNIFY